MADVRAIQFYAAIRKDPETLTRLGQAGSEEELIELIMDEAEKRGFIATTAIVKAALADLGPVVAQAAAGDELTDIELEIVSGGFGTQSQVRGPNIGQGCGGGGNTPIGKRQ